MVVLVAGASSSGKSYASAELKEYLQKRGLNSAILSTDSYNVGVSGIIVNKVNANVFNGSLQNIDLIKANVKNIIKNKDFDKKFDTLSLMQIKASCKNLIAEKDMGSFLTNLALEFDKINFDEATVYDLNALGKDVISLMHQNNVAIRNYSKVVSEQMESTETITGKNCDVIIIEGIFALNDTLLDSLKGIKYVKNYIDGDEKTLFLRRVLRDAKQTSADNIFTIKTYFDFVYPNFKKLILPTKDTAELILENNMTFEELQNGDILSKQQKVRVLDKKAVNYLLQKAVIISKELERDIYLETSKMIEADNLLRLRTISKDGGKTFNLSSLVHKGAVKLRTDAKIIRPINILIKEGEFDKIYKTEEEFLKVVKGAGFIASKTIIKGRTRLTFEGERYTIDNIAGNGTFIEYSSDNNSNFVRLLQNYSEKCNSFYEAIVPLVKVDAELVNE
ncbi:MAG: hypothetical protein AB7S44_00705 [Spirochaetales bacterium]